MIIYDYDTKKTLGNLAQENDLLDEMARGLRENVITDDLDKAVAYLKKYYYEYERLKALYDDAFKSQGTLLSEYNSLLEYVKQLRYQQKTAEADKYEAMLQNAKNALDRKNNELDKRREEYTTNKLIVFIIGRRIDKLIGASTPVSEFDMLDQYLDYAKNGVSGSKEKGVEVERKEEEEAAAAAKKKYLEEQEKFNKEYLQTATNEEETNFGKIAALAAALGLGILLFKGSKKKKKSKR